MPESAEETIDIILKAQNFYDVLFIDRHHFPALDVLRRRYVGIARKVHPDKYTGSHKTRATEAFQILATAHETLKDPTQRSYYDLGGAGVRNVDPDEILSQVLKKVYNDFMDGDFEVILSFVDAVNKSAMTDPAYRGGNEPIDRDRVRDMLIVMKNGLNHCGKISSELREPMSRFCEVYNQFKSLQWYQVFARLQLGVELLYSLCRIPLDSTTIQLPGILDSLMGLTANTLYYTGQGLGYIGQQPIPSRGSPTQPSTSANESRPMSEL
eukprot:CFRG6713T1